MNEGREAEELRAGVEAIIASLPGELACVEDKLVALLDRVDAGESLRYLEARDAPPPTRVQRLQALVGEVAAEVACLMAEETTGVREPGPLGDIAEAGAAFQKTIASALLALEQVLPPSEVASDDQSTASE